MDPGVPVTFRYEGFQLVGSLHLPDRPSSHAVILLNHGSVDRAGSHRLYIKIANQLTPMGVTVLRFDARGVGESDGMWMAEAEGRQFSILDAYSHIQEGVWKQDALAAIEFIQRTTGVSQIILGGLCGGATTAIFAGAEHPDVVGMILIGTPLTFSTVTQRAADLPNAVIERESGTYLRKMFQLSSWSRFISMRTDYRTLADVLFVLTRRRLKRLAGGVSTPAENDANVNMPLVDAILQACTRRKRLLFVFGENDYLWQEFQEHLPRFAADHSRLPFELKTIPHANHILTEESWQQAFFTSLAGWVDRLTGNQVRRLA